MDKNGKSTTVAVAAIVALIIGAVVGFGIGKGSDNKSMTKDSSSSSQAASSESDGVTVGGAKMVANLDIVDNAVNAKNVTTVVGLVKQAGLVETLKGVGPFTVFAPDNAAFEAVPKDLLNKVASNNELLKTVLTYHVVPGTYTSADLRAMAAKGETLKTVQGGMLSLKVVDNNVTIMDVAGQMVQIETPDVISSNGVTHVIKSVMLPVNPSTL